MQIRDEPFAIIALIFFAGWLLIGLPWLLTPSERIQYYALTQPEQQHSTNQPDGSEDSPFFVQVKTPPKNPEERHKEAEESQEKRDNETALVRWTAGLTISTVLLFAATVALGFFAYQQGREIKADTRILQRAYLSVEPGGINQFLDGTHRLACDIVMRNAGNLPATNVAWYITREIAVEGKKRGFTIAAREGKIVLPPKAFARKGSKNCLNRSEVLANKNPKGTDTQCWVYVWGQVDYLDGFNNRRFVKFCHRYNIGASNSEGAIGVRAGRYHEDGNETDEG